MDKIVVSLGGSVIAPEENKIAIGYLFQLKRILSKLKRKFFIVTGGGKIARVYINYGRKAKLKERELDTLGIQITYCNALLLKFIFGKLAYDEIITSEKILKKAIKSKKRIFISSGWYPGITTDYVAVKIASIVKAKYLVNISNVSYIYNKDPKKYMDAKPFKKLTWEEFLKIAPERKPGVNFIFDKEAIKLAKSKRITAYFVSYDIRNLENLLKQKFFEGTLVEPKI